MTIVELYWPIVGPLQIFKRTSSDAKYFGIMSVRRDIRPGLRVSVRAFVPQSTFAALFSYKFFLYLAD